jgi:hypothetical protein
VEFQVLVDCGFFAFGKVGARVQPSTCCLATVTKAVTVVVVVILESFPVSMGKIFGGVATVTSEADGGSSLEAVTWFQVLAERGSGSSLTHVPKVSHPVHGAVVELHINELTVALHSSHLQNLAIGGS